MKISGPPFDGVILLLTWASAELLWNTLNCLIFVIYCFDLVITDIY